MSSRGLNRPFFPRAPSQYEQAHQAEIQRAFELFIRQVQNPGDARHTTLTITNLQQGDNGLSPGELFESNGFVKVTKENQPNPIGVSGTAVLGVVTVVIT